MNDRKLLGVAAVVVVAIGFAGMISPTFDIWITVVGLGVLGLVVLGAIVHSLWQLGAIEWELHRPVRPEEIHIVDPPQAAMEAQRTAEQRRVREEWEKTPWSN